MYSYGELHNFIFREIVCTNILIQNLPAKTNNRKKINYPNACYLTENMHQNVSNDYNEHYNKIKK